MGKPKPTFSWDELDALMPHFSSTKPDDCFTTYEYADKYVISESAARRRMDPLVRSGKLEKLKYSTGQGKLGICYRIVRDGKKKA